ncbi:MAG: hypothetical protein JSS86_00040 [Cyanobacteria bacterium SZAS LIN-2]|nr:hypothetical protein [Cyanobacteria bacterium SZAS LIN-2]
MSQLKLMLSRFEIAVGLLALLFSLICFSLQFRCPEHSADCGGFELLGAHLGFIIGSSCLASGLLLRGDGIASWLGHLLILYAASLFFFLG